MRTMRAGLAAVAMIMCVGTAAANAATLTVTTTKDEAVAGDGLCALREAIIAVDSPGITNDCGMADPGSNTIVLGAHSYELTLAAPGLGFGNPTGCFPGFTHTENGTVGDLVITANVQNLTIEGAGADTTVIDACELHDRALNILAGASVSVRGLSIINGHPPGGTAGTNASTGGQSGTPGGPGANGGAILNAGTLTLTDVSVKNSGASDGGLGGSGAETIGGAAAGGSGASGGNGGGGGGIYSTGTLSLTDSTVSGNAAGDAGDGGAAAQATGTGGSGTGGSGGVAGGGGGIDSSGQLTITGSTITGNTAGNGGNGSPAPNDQGTSIQTGGTGGNGGAGGDGGGIGTFSGSLSITNSTITGNLAGNGGLGAIGGNGPGGDIVQGGNGGNGGRGGNGGGIDTAGLGSSSLLNVTIADNGAGARQSGAAAGSPAGTNGTAGARGLGGGLFVFTVGAPAALENTILAANNPDGNCGTNAPSINTRVTDGGHNLVFAPPVVQGINAGGACPSTFLSGDPKLGPLQDNLGPTETMALGAGSAAIDQVPSTGADCPATDQRGFQRPSGPACDIGAYEVTPPAVGAPTAAAIKANGAMLHDTLTANAVSATAQFEYGTTKSYGSHTNLETVSGLQPSTIAQQLSGLKPHTTYHYRVVATSADGTSTSADVTFTTAQNPPKLSKVKVKLNHGKATFSYRDSLAAHTTVIVFAVEPGIKHNGKCVKPGKHKSGSKCSLLVKVKRLTRKDKQGKNSVRFSVHGLAKGRYRIEATPSLNGATGNTESTQFRVT
jgi:hypothetical protein